MLQERILPSTPDVFPRIRLLDGMLCSQFACEAHMAKVRRNEVEAEVLDMSGTVLSGRSGTVRFKTSKCPF